MCISLSLSLYIYIHIYIYIYICIKGPPLRVNFEHAVCQLFVQNMTPTTTRQGCATSSGIQNNSLSLFVKFDPLPWSLNFLSVH